MTLGSLVLAALGEAQSFSQIPPQAFAELAPVTRHIEDALRGTDVVMLLHREGRVERRKKLRVTIPAGIDEGHQIRLSNEGEVGPRGGPAGSLYVAVHVAPHRKLTREATELYYELDVSIAQAALGTRVKVPTIEGDEEIEIKPGTQPGTELRLRGRGVPHLRRTGIRGDLHVLVNVAVPTKLSKRQRELLETYASESGETIDTNQTGRILNRVRDALG